MLHVTNAELIAMAALECDREADRQSAFANEAKEHVLALTHGSIAYTLMAVAQRIRALATSPTAPKEDEPQRGLGAVAGDLTP